MYSHVSGVQGSPWGIYWLFCIFLKKIHKVEADLLLLASRQILRVQIWSLRTLWEVCQKWRNSHSKWLKWIFEMLRIFEKIGVIHKVVFWLFLGRLYAYSCSEMTIQDKFYRNYNFWSPWVSGHFFLLYFRQDLFLEGPKNNLRLKK